MAKIQTIPLNLENIKFNEEFYSIDNLNLLKSRISEASHVDKGAYETLSLNLINEIDYFLGSGSNDDLSQSFFIKKLIDHCENYGYLKGKSKKFLKTVNQIKQNFIDIKDKKFNIPSENDKKNLESKEES